MTIKSFILLLSMTTLVLTARSQALYFPPISNTAAWDTTSPASLGWCIDQIDSLYDYLGQQNTKGFLVLKDGKIVLEKYYGTFTKDSLWYWASAGKTLTALLVGIAQEENFLSVSDTSSDYLGVGWTDCAGNQESKITLRNQLTMTSGLDDAVADNHCTLDSCLLCLADAGTRWAYHNAPYTLLENVLTTATSTPINSYTFSRISSKTGIYGAWVSIDYDNLFLSKVRNMGRFGLLMLNHGLWNGDTVLHDTAYFHQMVNTSQNLNLSYGYLWWLNGKPSFMVPGSQLVFPGSWAPDAPDDMVAGLGKNGQIMSISQSTGLVVVRMGDQPAAGEVPFQLCNSIWTRLNAIMCNGTAIHENSPQTDECNLFPNPSGNEIHLKLSGSASYQIDLVNFMGQSVYHGQNLESIDISSFTPGLYWLKVTQGKKVFIKKLLRE